MKLNINTDAAVIFTNKLEKLHRSALPNAIRSALNSAAFDVKQSTMPAQAAREFVNRSPNFFKANSRVEMAHGWDIKTMKSHVGFSEQGLKGGSNYAVKDLEKQESGGTIKGKSFIPLNPARSSGNNAKAVRPTNRLTTIKGIVNAKNAKGGNSKQKFIKSVAHAGRGGYVLAEFKGKEILWRVNSLNRTSSGQFKLTPIYSHKAGRSVNVKATDFMKNASMQSAKKMDDYYIEQAKKQIERLAK